MSNNHAFLGYNERTHNAYRVLFINRGCEEEREDPLEDYVVVINDIEEVE
jgi:hypothetical protein